MIQPQSRVVSVSSFIIYYVHFLWWCCCLITSWFVWFLYYRLNDEARALIAELGSSYISQIKFRDNWLFVGGKKTINQVRYEEVMPSPKSTMYVLKFMQWKYFNNVCLSLFFFSTWRMTGKLISMKPGQKWSRWKVAYQD